MANLQFQASMALEGMEMRERNGDEVTQQQRLAWQNYCLCLQAAGACKTSAHVGVSLAARRD